jgi:hypothetical protein
MSGFGRTRLAGNWMVRERNACGRVTCDTPFIVKKGPKDLLAGLHSANNYIAIGCGDPLYA